MPHVPLSAAVPLWWLPRAISEHARAYDAQFLLTAAVVGLLFLVSQGLLLVVVVRGRDRGQTPWTVSDRPAWERAWTLATAAIFIGLALAGRSVWTAAALPAPETKPMTVEVLAKQFAWSYRYPGADGVFGKTDARQIDDSTGNPFGVDSRDPNGRDDVTTALLRVPAGRPVELILRSRDVIHSFFVRELRLKQDVVPGMAIPLRFAADTPGTYEVPCSELCGLGHHQMRSALIVQSPEAFAEWMAEEQRKAAP